MHECESEYLAVMGCYASLDCDELNNDQTDACANQEAAFLGACPDFGDQPG